MQKHIRALLDGYLSSRSTELDEYVVERPRNPEFGHFSSNIAMKLAKHFRRRPLDIAEEIRSYLGSPEITLPDLRGEGVETVALTITTAAPGFINFTVDSRYFQRLVEEILRDGEDFRRERPYAGKRAQVEFVSANPTGPLTIGHGRQAVLGDVVARILEWQGYEVVREYYFNDAGRQMRLLGESVYARYMQLQEQDYAIPEGGYEGEYITDIARRFREKYGDGLTGDPQDRRFVDFANQEVFLIIRETLERLNIRHDVYYNEKDLYSSGKIREVLALLDEKGFVYQFEGATWFKATAFGAEKDRVLVKSSGEPTYRLPDIAYHREKLLRHFDLIVDIFGADHHATYPDVESGLKAMGLDTGSIRVLIHQFVTLTRDGEKVKMSTRKANFVTLDELADITGTDVVRFFYLMRSMDSHLNFDLGLAEKEGDENPVFYIQYAHARISNILLHSREKGIDSWAEGNLALLTEPEELELLKVMDEYGEVMDLAYQTLEPVNITNYATASATAFHKFYARHRVVSEDIPLSRARLKLISAVKQHFANLLGLLGIHAPDSM